MSPGRLTDEQLEGYERITRESIGAGLSEPYGMALLSIIRELRERRAILAPMNIEKPGPPDSNPRSAILTER